MEAISGVKDMQNIRDTTHYNTNIEQESYATMLLARPFKICKKSD